MKLKYRRNQGARYTAQSLLPNVLTTLAAGAQNNCWPRMQCVLLRFRYGVCLMPSLPHSDPAIQEALLAHALTATATAIFITDRTGTVVWTNDAFSRLCGYRREEIIGRTPAILKSGRQSNAFYAQLWETMLAGKVWQGEIVDRRQDGSLYTADEIITPLF